MNEHRAGPVRSAAAREAILDRDGTISRRQGYDQLTIEGIAKEAGVGKQTIYRWWRSRGALIAECLTEAVSFRLDLAAPDTGDLGRGRRGVDLARARDPRDAQRRVAAPLAGRRRRRGRAKSATTSRRRLGSTRSSRSDSPAPCRSANSPRMLRLISSGWRSSGRSSCLSWLAAPSTPTRSGASSTTLPARPVDDQLSILVRRSVGEWLGVLSVSALSYW